MLYSYKRSPMSMIKASLKDFKLSGIYKSYEERIKYALDK